jgi:DNA polymerase-3 subunit gamma/tau
MDYLVFARKLRPARFADLIGQDSLVTILKNAIRQDRVAHAFLFAGSRGVGKTSAARILTKLWNCLDPQDAEPCNVCTNCREITSNASPDVYEIDAASNRGIDNIRELREGIKFAPAKCRYKTYIIDEVHMLTTESFNALLKTLEEPPPHVKFILATTAPHKIPETILSRCQRFDFSRIAVARMTDYLVQVTAQEGISISRAALESLARNSAGGMRDALTSLDQVVAFCGTTVADEQVTQILGLMDNRVVLNLLGTILDQTAGAALASFSALVEHGHDLQAVLEALLRDVKDLSLFSALGKGNGYFQDHAPETLTFFAERAPAIGLDRLQQLFYLLLELESQLKRSQFAQACFEMALVKACQVQSLVAVPELLEHVRALLGGGSLSPPVTTPTPGGGGGGASPGPRARPVNPFTSPGSKRPSSVGSEAESAAPAVEAPTVAAFTLPPPGPIANAAASVPGEAPPADPKAHSDGQGVPLVDDARWEQFVARVMASPKKKLGADLKKAEPLLHEGQLLELVPASDTARENLLAEREWMGALLAEIFGAEFKIEIVRDTNRTAAGGRSLLDKRTAAEQARRDGMKQAALEDEAIRRIQRFFPEGKVESVSLPETPSD